MAVETSFDATGGFLRVTLTGRWPTILEQFKARDRARSLGYLRRDTPVLIDLRGITESPDADEVRLAIAAARESEGWARRRGLLVGTATQLEVASLFASLASSDMAVFQDEQAAVDWLSCVTEHMG